MHLELPGGLPKIPVGSTDLFQVDQLLQVLLRHLTLVAKNAIQFFVNFLLLLKIRWIATRRSLTTAMPCHEALYVEYLR